jgi:ABC-2 type transport system permease protein
VKHVTSVAGRELRGLFVSPVAYAVLSLFAILAGVFFIVTVAAFNDWIFRLQQFQAFDQLEQLNLNDHLIGQFYQTMSVVLLFLIPGVTMGLFAAEKTNGTQELLLTCPLTIWDIVLGKFVAGAIFVALLVFLVGLYPGILFLHGDPELGKSASGLLGLLLVGWTYVAIGVFASSLTRSQVIAFLLTFVLLLVLLILPAISDLGVASSSELRGLLRYLSTDVHLAELVKGLLDTADLAYFGVMIGCFLVLTKAAVESVRWR